MRRFNKLAKLSPRFEDLMICEDSEEARALAGEGFNTFVWSGTERELICLVTHNYLKRKYPSIKWETVLGSALKKAYDIIEVEGGEATIVHDAPANEDSCVNIAVDDRRFDGGIDEVVEGSIVSLESMILDENSNIDFDVLAEIKLMPRFIVDVSKRVDIKSNNYSWHDGYNKKRRLCCGNVEGGGRPVNLLIIDVSNSIPRGISAALLELAADMRTRFDADLIVTGSTSMLWRRNEDLPDPLWIRNHIGFGNECAHFTEIIKKYEGTPIGNIVCFGDNDHPALEFTNGFQVGEVLSYHTRSVISLSGYCRWAAPFAEKVTVSQDKWCRYLVEE